MAMLTFPGDALLELLAHAKAAPEHRSGYPNNPDCGPGLLFVKDSGIYVMSNGWPGLKIEDDKPGQKAVYAKGYEPAKMVEDRGGDWNAQYSKIEAAAGGDDFVELLPEKFFSPLKPGGTVKIRITRHNLSVYVLPPRMPRARKK